MFSNIMDVFTGRAPLVMREEIRVSSDRLAGCDVIRLDHLNRRVVVVPQGQPVPPDIALTSREEALVYPAPPPRREKAMRSSGSGFYFE